MEDVISTLSEISKQLDWFREMNSTSLNKITELEEKQSSIVKSFVEQHGWSAIAVGDDKLLPYQNHDGTFGLRKL